MNDFYAIIGVMLIIWFILYKLLWLDKYLNFDFNNKMEKENQFKLVTEWKVFTNTELKFFNELNLLVNNTDYYLFTKIRLVDLVRLKKAEYGKYMSIFNKLSKKHIDFIIVDKYWKIKVLIELDDKSHNNKKVKQNDDFKNELALYLNILLIRYNAWNNYNFENLKNILV
jgi:hypothetical protein